MRQEYAASVIICHRKTRWDALSAMLAAAILYPGSVILLPRKKKNVTAFLAAMPALPAAWKTVRKIDPATVKRVIVIGAQRWADTVQGKIFADRPSISAHVWDQHPPVAKNIPGISTIQATGGYCQAAGSVCTLLCTQLQRSGYTPTSTEATTLGLGLYVQTHGFTSSATSMEDCLAAVWLHRYGMNIQHIAASTRALASDPLHPIPGTATRRIHQLQNSLQSLPDPIRDILNLVGNLGDETHINVYAVGGFVRDILAGRADMNTADVDVAVEGNSLTFAQGLACRLHGHVRTHPTFMTARVLYADAAGTPCHLDVAATRREYYLHPAALPTVEAASINADLFRRDLSINAMALQLNTGQFGRILDMHGGQNDIMRQRINVLHAISFVEDPTRIMRAIRFEQRLGFCLSKECQKLLHKALALQLLRRVSGHRIMQELRLMFRESTRLACLKRLHQLGVLAAIHPLLKLNSRKITHLEAMTASTTRYAELLRREHVDITIPYLLALCGTTYPQKMDACLYRLGFSQPQRERLQQMCQRVRAALPQLRRWSQSRQHHISSLCALLAPLPVEGLLYCMALVPDNSLRTWIARYLDTWRHVHADISGKDLIRTGLKPGPRLGHILNAVLAAKLDNPSLTRAEQYALAQKLARQER